MQPLVTAVLGSSLELAAPARVTALQTLPHRGPAGPPSGQSSTRPSDPASRARAASTDSSTAGSETSCRRYARASVERAGGKLAGIRSARPSIVSSSTSASRTPKALDLHRGARGSHTGTWHHPDRSGTAATAPGTSSRPCGLRGRRLRDHARVPYRAARSHPRCARSRTDSRDVRRLAEFQAIGHRVRSSLANRSSFGCPVSRRTNAARSSRSGGPPSACTCHSRRGRVRSAKHRHDELAVVGQQRGDLIGSSLRDDRIAATPLDRSQLSNSRAAAARRLTSVVLLGSERPQPCGDQSPSGTRRTLLLASPAAELIPDLGHPGLRP